VLPSLIYPSPNSCSGSAWKWNQNKAVFGPTGDDVLNFLGIGGGGGPGPGRHANGQEDYN